MLFGWQAQFDLEPKCAAFSGDTINPHLTAHQIDNTANNSQPETSTIVLTSVCAIKGFEVMENAINIFGMNANARVYNPELKLRCI